MDSSDKPILYTGQSVEDIPQNVTHVKVDRTVKEIGGSAFQDCRQLRSVELCKGLEPIDDGAFDCCTSLESINIPSSIKVISGGEFCDCRQLMNVELCQGLERIGIYAFDGCTSLVSIRIPSTVKMIGKWAFAGCSQLINVELCEGLERIDERAFRGCTSLTSIQIPSTVNYIERGAFSGCDSLLAIEFSEEIEQFVDEVLLPWWNHGVSEASLRTYSFLVQGNIPARLDTIKSQKWKITIHVMLQRIPEQLKWVNKFWIDRYFDSIEYRLSDYEQAQEVVPFLELALWKVKITEQSNGSLINDDSKILCRIDSFSMFAIIFPNVLSFFFEE